MAPRSDNEAAAGGGMRRNFSMTSLADTSDGEDGPKKDYRDYKVRKSGLIGMVNWTHVFGTFAPHIFFLGIAVLFGQIIYQVAIAHSSDLMLIDLKKDNLSLSAQIQILVTFLVAIKDNLYNVIETIIHSHGLSLLSPEIRVTVLSIIIFGWIVRMDNPVYLLDFATFKAPESWKVSHDQIIDMMRHQKCFTQESLDFMKRILARSGTGQSTAWPPGIVQCLEGKETDSSIEGSRQEAEIVICDIVAQVFKKTGISPDDIDILVINCSLFSPTPSLCAMVVSKFKLRQDIQSFNLSGMGCGASLISVDLAKNLLQRRSFGGKALVISTEVITPNLYKGNSRGFLLQNTLFRCGGVAMILSNKWSDGRRAMYKLLHVVRVQGNSDDAYNCVFETNDEEGKRGVRLSKEIVKVAGKCMEKNMTTIGPYVLPLTEQVKVVIAILSRFVVKKLGKALNKSGMEKIAMKLPNIRPFVPDFKRGIDHFCIHAGGRAVIDGIEKNMKLELFHTEPSRMALLNYGNTSSSSIWYELEYIQEHQKTNPLKKGHRIMQVAFGSGFKCTSGVWLKL